MNQLKSFPGTDIIGKVKRFILKKTAKKTFV